MKQYNTVIGMDLGDKQNRFCVLDTNGELLQEGRLPNTAQALAGMLEKRPSALIAIEAGTHSPWVSRRIKELGHEVLIGNPRKLRAVYQSERKSDTRDAEMLARIARMDPQLLYPIQHRSKRSQAHLAILQARDQLVQTRTKLINCVRSTVKSFGARLPKCDADTFHKKVREHIPGELRAALFPVLESIAQLTKTIFRYDADIKRLCEENYPETEALRSLKGVGSITALAYVLILQSPDRFARSRSVPAFIGITPRRDQSGDNDPQLPITKAGNRYLRRLLIGAARYILGPFGQDCELRRWGMRLARSGTKRDKNRAAVAVARKLAVILHRLWTTGELFEPFPKAQNNNTRPQPQHAAN